MIFFEKTVAHFGVKVNSSLNIQWMVGVNCNSVGARCNSSSYGYSDSDGTNIHSAYTIIDSPKYTIYFSLDLASGTASQTLRRTNSNRDLDISSLYVDGNGVTWISLYDSSGYSELISYTLSSGSSKTYKQSGAAYFYQFVNSANRNYWYGVAFQSYVTEVKLYGISFINILSVSTSGGLIDDGTTFFYLSSFPAVTGYSNASATSQSLTLSDLDISVSTSSRDVPVIPEEDATAKAAATTLIVFTSVTIAVAATANIVSSISALGASGAAAGGGAAGGGGPGGNDNAGIGVAAGAGAGAGMGAAAAAAASNGSSSSGSKQSLWAIINLYQEIVLIPMLGTYLGNDFHYYITEFQLAFFKFQFFDSIKFPVIETAPELMKEIDYEQPDLLFAFNEFESGSAFTNCFQILKLIFIFFL